MSNTFRYEIATPDAEKTSLMERHGSDALAVEPKLLLVSRSTFFYKIVYCIALYMSHKVLQAPKNTRTKADYTYITAT